MTSNPQKLGEGPGADSLSTAWGGTSPANTLTLGFQPPDPGRTKSLLFNHSVCGALLWPPQDTDTGTRPSSRWGR